MGNWRSYDSVAEDYDRLWGPRFEIAAGHLLTFAAPTPGSRLLDLGAGTGELGAAGRFGREALGQNRWRAFLERSEDRLRHRFGDQLAYARPLIVGVAAVG